MSTNVMLCNILRMPFDDHGDAHLIRLHEVCHQAAEELINRTERITELEQENAKLRARISEINFNGSDALADDDPRLIQLRSRVIELEEQLEARHEYLTGLRTRLDAMIQALTQPRAMSMGLSGEGRGSTQDHRAQTFDSANRNLRSRVADLRRIFPSLTAAAARAPERADAIAKQAVIACRNAAKLAERVVGWRRSPQSYDHHATGAAGEP